MHPGTPVDPSRQRATHGPHVFSHTDSGGSGAPLVMLHGLPGSIRDFRWLEPALPESVRIIRVELPGYGEAPREAFRPLSIEDRASYVVALLDHLDLEDVTLVTHSAGAIVASTLATTYPDKIARLALLAPPGPTPHFPIALYRPLSKLLEYPLGRMLLAPLQRKFYTAMGFPSTLSDDTRAYTTLDAAILDFSRHRRDLGNIPHPTMVAWAHDDRIIPESRFYALEALVPMGPRLRFEVGGHNIQKTMATEIAQELLAFHTA